MSATASRNRVIRHQQLKALKDRRRAVQLRYTRKALDRAKDFTGSDAGTARALALSAQKLSDIRHGRRPLPPASAIRLAKLMNLNSFVAMTKALADTAKSKTNRTFWLDIGSGMWFIRRENFEAWSSSRKPTKYPS